MIQSPLPTGDIIKVDLTGEEIKFDKLSASIPSEPLTNIGVRQQGTITAQLVDANGNPVPSNPRTGFTTRAVVNFHTRLGRPIKKTFFLGNAIQVKGDSTTNYGKGYGPGTEESNF